MEENLSLKNAETCLNILHNYFSDKNIEGQAQVVLPKSIIPNSKVHYQYLFYSCLLNYGMKSTSLHKNMIYLYEQYPNVFSPGYVVEKYSKDYTDLADVLRSYVHVRYPNECAKRWIGLSEVLHLKYNDNPKEMFRDKSTYNDYKKSISQIKGLGQKTGGLLLRILIDNNMLSPIDGITEIPIDRHDIDLCIWLNVISNFTADEIRKNTKIIKALSDVWVQAANNLSISPSLADQYLWIIGSEFCASKKCIHCPVFDLCNRMEC